MSAITPATTHVIGFAQSAALNNHVAAWPASITALNVPMAMAAAPIVAMSDKKPNTRNAISAPCHNLVITVKPIVSAPLVISAIL